MFKTIKILSKGFLISLFNNLSYVLAFFYQFYHLSRSFSIIRLRVKIIKETIILKNHMFESIPLIDYK